MRDDHHERVIEERIEALLAGLRKAEPAAGMEQRINAALLRAAGAVPSAMPRRAWLRLPQLAGLTAAAASLVLFSVYLHHRAASLPMRHRVSVITTDTSTHQPQESAMNASSTGTGGLASAQAAPHREAIANSSVQPAINQRRTVGPRSNEASQTAQTAEAEQGFPAPPLPLTVQERLLIRLVHRDDPRQLAQLAPAAREAELRRDREQVREFFKPPPMLSANFTLEPYPTPGGTQ